MLKIAKPWIIYLVGLCLEIGVDYFLRMQDGNIRSGGLPDSVLFLISVVLAGVSVGLVFIATKPLMHIWKRLLSLVVQVVLGFVIYLFVTFNYVLGTGIDSL